MRSFAVCAAQDDGIVHSGLIGAPRQSLTFESIESNAFELRQTAGIARVHGELTIRARYSKSNYNGTFRYMGVYMKQSDDWKLLVTSARPASVQAQDGERHKTQ